MAQASAQMLPGRRTTRRNALAALVVIGATLCGGSLLVLVRRELLLRSAVQASGVVVRIEPTYEAHVAGLFHHVPIPPDIPIIQFRTGDDREVVATLPSTSPGQYVRGQSVSLLYSPRHPRYIATTRVAHWLDLITFFVIGMFCSVSLIWLR
jgi:hypothetical protein